ncbi:MAG: DEAD/DEAH box helicase, partial [Chloroflexota bacterium]
MNLEQLLTQMKAELAGDRVAAWRVLPARPAKYAEFPELAPGLADALRAKGVRQLYSHQRLAWDAVAAGRNAVIVTPTASGKTLCYNLPVLDAILRDQSARALYLFPTKALAQDQMAEVHELITILGADIKTFTYDGDTPGAARRAIRTAGHIVVTNPDMLHTGILPHHTKWVKLFESLRYVVIDEMHQYRGVFGSHMANLIRRLKRICEFYGSRPQFILSSATIANPRELAGRLIAAEVDLIDDNGAPAGEKHVILYNPPVVNRELGIRKSSVIEARNLAANFLRNGIQTIVFARSRTTTEVLVTYLKEAMAGRPGGSESVRGYRGGYLPLQRREIERGLREGRILGVVSTNALELGIDIGRLDATVICGYPGSVSSTWQQFGRAGRRAGTSVAVLVADSSPLDQFMMANPDYFFGSAPEHGLINPDNLHILLSHLKCAAFELPFQDGEEFGVETTQQALAFLEEERILRHVGGKWHWAADN